MKENHLLVPKNRFLKAPRKAKTQKPRTVIPNRYWGIDMTKVMIPAFGWIYLHVVIDWGTKKLLSFFTIFVCSAGCFFNGTTYIGYPKIIYF